MVWKAALQTNGTDHMQGGDGTRTEKEGRGAFVSFSDLVSLIVWTSQRSICVSSVQLKETKGMKS